jgi:hypothetical protein
MAYAPLFLGHARSNDAGWLVWPMRNRDAGLNRRPDARALANSIYALVRQRR